MVLLIKDYKINDYGAYKTVDISYNSDKVITYYSVDNGDFSENGINRICVPCVALCVEVYGVVRGVGSSQTIKIDLVSKKIIPTTDIPNFNGMVKQKTTYENNTFDSMYFVDIMTDGSELLSLPRRVNRKELDELTVTVTVEGDMQNRIDFVAEKYLGDGRLWWVIAEFNGIINPSVLERGTTLLIPDISDIYGVDGPLREPDIPVYNN